jgi:hypothetical protein
MLESWGWATWQRSWRLFEEDGSLLLRKITERNLKAEFDVDNSYPYTGDARPAAQGQVDSWAIRWQASAFCTACHAAPQPVAGPRTSGTTEAGTHCAKILSLMYT